MAESLTAKSLKGMSRAIQDASRGREELASAAASVFAMRSELFGKSQAIMSVRAAPDDVARALAASHTPLAWLMSEGCGPGRAMPLGVRPECHGDAGGPRAGV